MLAPCPQSVELLITNRRAALDVLISGFAECLVHGMGFPDLTLKI
jgi:hypothetical protein